MTFALFAFAWFHTHARTLQKFCIVLSCRHNLLFKSSLMIEFQQARLTGIDPVDRCPRS